MNRTPVVFIHGAWLHALSWESWAERFASRGYLVLTPGWPGEAAVARDMRAFPEAIADIGLDALTDHYAAIVRSFDTSPVLVGHSVGGLIAQHLIGADIGRAAVAIAPTAINDVAGDVSRAAARRRSCLPGGHLTRRAVPLSPEQFRSLFANTVEAQESDRLFERYVIPAPSRLLADLGDAGPAPSPRPVVDTGNAGRGPLLIVSGQEDLLVPDAVTRAVYKQYGDSPAVTELKQFADRGHSLVIDGGWRFLADYVLGWLGEHGVRAVAQD